MRTTEYVARTWRQKVNYTLTKDMTTRKARWNNKVDEDELN